MNEKFSTPESQEKISREQVISAYKKFVERGITSPDKLDLDDPEVIEAAVGCRGEGRRVGSSLPEVRQADAAPEKGVRAESRHGQRDGPV